MRKEKTETSCVKSVFSRYWHNRIFICTLHLLSEKHPSKVFLTLISDQSKVSECVLVVWTLDVSNLVRFGRGVICLEKEITWLQVVIRCVTFVTS